MALALSGRGSLHTLTASGYGLTPRLSPHVVRGCKLPRPKRARAIIPFPGGKQQFKMPAPSKGSRGFESRLRISKNLPLNPGFQAMFIFNL